MINFLFKEWWLVYWSLSHSLLIAIFFLFVNANFAFSHKGKWCRDKIFCISSNPFLSTDNWLKARSRNSSKKSVSLVFCFGHRSNLKSYCSMLRRNSWPPRTNVDQLSFHPLLSIFFVILVSHFRCKTDYDSVSEKFVERFHLLKMYCLFFI